MSHKNFSNLKSWKPGQSGNPAGRKPGSKNVSTIVRELLEQDADTNFLQSTNVAGLTNGKTTTYTQAIVLAMIKRATEGNVQAAKWLTAQHEQSYTAQNAKGFFHTDHLVIKVVPSKSTVDQHW